MENDTNSFKYTELTLPTRRKILVVDDEKEITCLLEYNLKQHGYDVDCAYTGEQALQLARSDKPDLIVLDFMLPLLKGPEVAAKLKQIVETADIPIIYLTARSDTDSIVEGLGTGAVDYITKPFNMIELLARIKTQLKLKDTLDKLKKTEIELRKAEVARDKLFAIFVHDLRGPFHTLGGFIDRLYSRYDKLSEPERESIIQIIKQKANFTRKHLETVLNWTRMQTGLFHLSQQEINLKATVDEIADLYSSQLAEKGLILRITVNQSAVVFADQHMVEAILRNLVQNAIKFTPAEGWIHIRSKRVGKYEEISVSDSGIGITQENLGKIFCLEQHYSAPDLNGEKGTGLGLILCKDFVELNGGTIDVHSMPDEGTEFRFKLPHLQLH